MPSNSLPDLVIHEITSPKAWLSLYPLVRQLNPDLDKKQFQAMLRDMLKNNYRCVGAYRGKKLVGALGLWTGTRFWCGKYIEADNVVVDQKLRNSGIGRALFAWLDKEATRLGCDIVIADSYTHNYASHRFYLRERYNILGFCFVKKLKGRR